VLLMPGSVLIGSETPIPFDPTTLAARFADPAVQAHLARGNREFGTYADLFAQPPLIWSPGMPRAEATLTDVFPRDEFYLNNGVTGTQRLRRPQDVLMGAVR